MVIISIQHTGTRYLAKHRPHSWSGHVTTQNMAACRENLWAEPGLVPMRHPALVYESWQRRVNSGDKPNIDNLHKQFDNLIQLDREFDLEYVFVDDTSWGEPVSTHGNAHTTITPAMLDRVPGKVMAFYIRIRK